MVEVTLFLIGLGFIGLLSLLGALNRNQNTANQNTTRSANVRTDGGTTTGSNNSNSVSRDDGFSVPAIPSEPSGPGIDETEEAVSEDIAALQALMPQGNNGSPIITLNNNFQQQQQQQQQQMGRPGFLPPILGQYPQTFMPVPTGTGNPPIPPITPPGGGEAQVPEKVPRPEPLRDLIKRLEKPVKAFLLMSAAGDKDLEKIIKQADKLESIKNKERKKLEKVKTKLEDAETHLEVLNNTQINQQKAQDTKNNLISTMDRLESKIEAVEDHQSSYENLIKEEDKEVVKIAKKNAHALKDIDNLINDLNMLAETTEVIAPLIETAEEKEAIKLSAKELENLEKFLEKTLGNETQLAKELQKLEETEAETERIEEQELEDIKTLLEEDQRFKSKLEQAQNKGNLTSEEYNNIIDNINRLSKVLQKLGKDIKEEEKLEENVIQDVESIEDQVESQEQEDEEDLTEAEEETQQAEEAAEQATADPRDNMSTGWDFSNAQEWRDLLDRPNDYIDEGDIAKYNQLKLFSYIEDDDKKAQYTTPYQAFKLHVSAYPGEGLEVAKHFIPVLQKHNIRHKVFHSLSTMVNRKNYAGEDDSQLRKFMTIYIPGDSENVNFTHGANNEDNMFNNKSQTIDILDTLINEIDDRVLQGGPKVKGKRNMHGIEFTTEEFRVGNTRIFLKYDIAGKGEIKLDNEHLLNIINYDGISDDELFRDDFLEYRFNDKSKIEKVKKSIKGEITGEEREPALLGKDGKIAGAYYLPPPEAIEEAKQIANSY